MFQSLFSKKKQKEGNSSSDIQKLIFSNEHVPEGSLDLYSTRGDAENVLRLLEKGQSVNNAEHWLRTPLHWAAIAGHPDVVLLLLKWGANINATDEDGMTALHYASKLGHVKVVQEIIDLQYPKKDVRNKWGETAYDMARDPKIIELLSPKPPVPQFVVESRSVDLWDYAELGEHRQLQKLISEGKVQSINRQGSWGRSPLIYAAIANQHEVANLLLKQSAKPDLADVYGWTALHWASNNGHLETVKVLLQHNANKTKTTPDGKTPRDLAKRDDIRYLFDASSVEIYDFLAKYQLANYSKKFADEEITMEVLPTLTDEDLKNLGFTLGARKKVSLALRDINSNIGLGSSSETKLSTSGTTNLSGSIEIHENVFLSNVELLELIGGGAFGKVYKALWAGTTIIAAKKLHSEENTPGFEAEAAILRKLRHPNIVSYLGIYKVDQITLKFDNLLKLAMDVCGGMQFLNSNKIIHRDLAARNVLCKREGESFLGKVSDFGLSRLVENSYYDSNSKSKFAFKWTAPEAIKYSKFSPASDVYSYGVLLWEIFSVGEIPWADLTNKEAAQVVMEGKTLSKPEGCSDHHYKLMQDCWSLDPHTRPDWLSIFNKLKEEFPIWSTTSGNFSNSGYQDE